MNIKDITELSKLCGHVFKDNLVRFYSLLASPRNFFSSIKYDTTEELIQASVFAVFISALNLVIISPVQLSIGVDIETASYALTDTVLTYSCWFLAGSVVHLLAKLLKGSGSYQSTVVAFLYLMAFTPILLLVSIPLELTTRHFIIESPFHSSYKVHLGVAESMSKFPVLHILSSVLQLAVVAYFIRCSVIVFRILHHVGRVRGVLIGVLGFAGWQLVTVFIKIPILQLFWKGVVAN